ncbi:transcription factor iws1-like [Lathyrus oleraceus]|uniref:transcription factor iws1-like n=1 Tax=Pisum sativum TaxID=3888 RepID=UPI0021CF4CA8|nr:transcription factor iws1-like [Pisum sativum]
MDITLEETTDYMLCDQEADILDFTPYLVRVQKDSVDEGLICNQDENEDLECNQEDEDGGNENDSALNVNFEDFDEDAIGIGEEIILDKEDGKGKEKGKRAKEKLKERGKGKGKVKGKGKGKGKCKGKGKTKVGRPRKQRKVEEAVEGSSSIDNEDEEVPKESFRGLCDVEECDSDELPQECDSDELPQECDSEDEDVLKDDFQTLKLPKRMVDYKWELGTYFATKE